MDILDPKELRRIRREERRGLRISNLVDFLGRSLQKLGEGLGFLEDNVSYLSASKALDYIEEKVYAKFDNLKIVKDLKYKKIANKLVSIVEKIEADKEDNSFYGEAPISGEIDVDTGKGYIAHKRLLLNGSGIVECTRYSLSTPEINKHCLENTLTENKAALPHKTKRVVPKEEFLEIAKTYGKDHLMYVYIL